MDKVKVDEEQIVSMDAIAPGFNGLKITFVNVSACGTKMVAGR